MDTLFQYSRFWLAFVVIISILQLTYMLTIFIIPCTRKAALNRDLMSTPKGLRKLIGKINFGDFLLWVLIAKNIDDMDQVLQAIIKENDKIAVTEDSA